MALRVTLGGHHVPEDDVRRRFARSRRHFIEDYLPLADEWGLWDNHEPPIRQLADDATHAKDAIKNLISQTTLMETHPKPLAVSAMSEMVLEASRAATAEMLDYYKRMGIKVTPQMTLAPERKRRAKKP